MRNIGRVRLLLIGTSLSLMISGCSTELVQSVPAASSVGKNPVYARYMLQHTVVTVTVDDAGAGSASTTTPNSTSVTNTVTVNTAAPAAAADKKDAPTLAATCADLRKTYDQNRLLYIIFRAAQSKLEGQIDQWNQQGVATKADDIKTTLEAYTKIRVAGAGGYSAAGETISTINKYCATSYKLSLTQKDEADPDPTKSYQLTVAPNDFYDDQLNVQTGGDGTLVSVGYTSVDRTSDILVNVAKSITTIAVSAIGVPPVGAGQQVAGQSCPLGNDPKSWIAKIPATPAATFYNSLHTCVEHDQDNLPDLDDIDVKHFERAVGARDGFQRVVLPHNLTLYIRCPGSAAEAAPAGQVAAIPAPLSPPPGGNGDGNAGTDLSGSQTQAGSTSVNGVLVSTPLSCVATFTQTTEAPLDAADTDYSQWAVGSAAPGASNERVLGRSAFVAVDSDKPQRLPLTRTSFVTRTANYGFTAGRLTSATYNRPSPLVNAALLPATLVGAVVGTITGQITTRSSNLGAKTQYKQAQADYLAAQAKLKKAQDDAEKPKDAAGATTPTAN